MGDVIDVDFFENHMCSVCHARRATCLCDFPAPRVRLDVRRGSCDRPLCRECAIHLAGDIDICPDCAERLARAKRRKELTLKK